MECDVNGQSVEQVCGVNGQSVEQVWNVVLMGRVWSRYGMWC
jgi:hypothetical protein